MIIDIFFNLMYFKERRVDSMCGRRKNYQKENNYKSDKDSGIQKYFKSVNMDQIVGVFSER